MDQFFMLKANLAEGRLGTLFSSASAGGYEE